MSQTTDNIDTSSISFTGLYTGQTWVENGLASPAFSTALGNLYYRALTPFEMLGRRVFGDSLRTALLQRHRLIDHRLRQAIADDRVGQVLEIACGLSPRGCRFKTAYPELTYIETDLPEMAARKQKLLDKMDGPRPEVMPINIFAEEGELSLEYVLTCFDQSEPIAVITEGLILYFDRKTITGFWTKLSQNLRDFPLGIYLTDSYPLSPKDRFHRPIEVLSQMLSLVARSKVTFHFEDDAEARQYFGEVDFDGVDVHNPCNYYELLDLPKSRKDPFARVIEARVGG